MLLTTIKTEKVEETVKSLNMKDLVKRLNPDTHPQISVYFSENISIFSQRGDPDGSFDRIHFTEIDKKHKENLLEELKLADIKLFKDDKQDNLYHTYDGYWF